MKPHLGLTLSIVVVLLLNPVVLAEEVELGEIVVTPFRAKTEWKPLYSQGEIIESDVLEDRNIYTVTEGLQLIDTLEVVGGGRLGSSSLGVFLRGAQPRHTVYLFNGIKIYDASNTSAYYVPSHFLTTGLSRIEVVKFPLSSLYGSSAMGGVINFIPKKPQSSPYVIFTKEGGSFLTNEESLELGGKIDKLSYLFNISRLDVQGLHRAKVKNNNPEKDPYQNTNLTLNIDFSDDSDFNLGLSFKGGHSRAELDDDDNSDGIPEDDSDNKEWTTEIFSTAYLNKQLASYLKYHLQLGLVSIYRRNEDDTDEYTRSWYRGKTYQVSSSFQIIPFDFYKAILGFDYTRDKMDSYLYTEGAFGPFESDFNKNTTYTKGYFIENLFNIRDKFNLDFSYRREEQPLFKSHSVVKAGFNYLLTDNLGLYFSYGEGFKAPSLYQLFSSNGNRELKPEESKSWEVGIKHKFNDYFIWQLGYFHNDFRNLIDFVVINLQTFQGRYMNAAKEKTRGVELNLEFKPKETLMIKGGYSYIRGEQDFVDDDFVTIFKHSLVRVPKHKAFLDILFNRNDLKATLNFSYVGRRFDRIWVGATDEFVKMKSYLLLNFWSEYIFNPHTTIFFKVNNILNKDYERIKGYQEERLSFWAGVRLKF